MKRGYINIAGQFTEDSQGYLIIYEWPREDESYVIGADVSEGITVDQQSVGEASGDFSSAHVLSRQGFKVVATWHGRIDPDVFATELIGTSRLFRGAIIGVERNNQGIAVCQRLRESHYPAVYKRQLLDKITKKTVSEIGWRTDLKTKPLMIDELREAIREQSIEIPDEQTILECLSYQRDEAGRMSAPSGMYDDRVISLAIAVQMRKLTTAMNYDLIVKPNPNSAKRVFEEAMKRQKYGG
ncbi:MAG: hypothetical protein ABIJ08_07295 [Nanoarchaeota archaeon]